MSEKRTFGRFGCFIFCVIVGLIWSGGQKLYVGLTNLSPAEMPLAEYLAKRPSNHWLTLKDCELDMPHTLTNSTLFVQTITELYIPVRVPGDDTKPVVVFFSTKDAALIKQMENLKSITDKQALLKYVINGGVELYPKRTLSGQIRSGMDLEESDREKIAKLDHRVATDFVILDDGKKPELVEPAFMLICGIVILIAVLTYKPAQRIESKPENSPPETSSDTNPPQSPPA